MSNKTKVICTIGPASFKVAVLEKLILKGMDIARLNFSFGDFSTHSEYINNIRSASQNMNKFIPIIQDLQGPKIRIGKLKNQFITLIKGKEIIISSKKIFGDENCISTSYKNFVRDVNINDFILIDDGLLRLKVVDKKNTELHCTIIKGGILKEHKGVNLPNSIISIPSLTQKDKTDLIFGLKNNINAVALSFVRKADDIIQLKKLISELGKYVPVIAKIERPEAIINIDEIIDVADIIMVARGDMGVEISPEDVPVLQKMIIEKCNRKYKPVITATQMLDSMTNNRIPTRAEASDVANAILDGTDCVMLSGETSVGIDPENVVNTMEKIIMKTENFRKSKLINTNEIIEVNELEAICKSAISLTNEIKAKSIITFTKTGKSPKYLSSYRVNTEIIAITENDFINTINQFIWGVYGIKIKKSITETEITNFILEKLSKDKIFKTKDKIVLLLSSGKDKYKSADTIKIISK